MIEAKLADLRHDLQYGLRTFRKSPGFTAVAMLTLALGVGATVTVFSVVEAVLLRPLPYQNGDRLVAIWLGHVKDKSLAKIFASYNDFEHWQRTSQTVEQFAAATWATGDQIITGRGAPKVALAIPVSVDFFSLLGVSPIRGRTFEAADLNRGCTVVLSHRFWQNTLGGQADIAGQSVALDGRACTIVGVMPERFAFFPDAADMWSVITPNREQLPGTYKGVGVFGRLRAGVSLERAQAELSALHQQLHGSDGYGTAFRPTVYPLQEEFTWLAGRNLRLTLMVLFAAVSFVLLIACANVANLLLGRSLARQREFAIRAALGSGRSRIMRQVLTEGLLLSSVGTVLGVLLTIVAVRSFRALGPVELPPGTTIAVNVYVLLFASVLAGATALVFGLGPAWRASRADISTMLKATGRAAAGRLAGARTGSALVVVEMTCAMVLLAGAGLLAQSIIRLGATPLGFEPDGLLTLAIRLPKTTYPKPDQRTQLYDRLVDTLGSLPSVDGVALATTLLRGHSSNLLTVEGRPQATLETAIPDVGLDFVSRDYFQMMGVPIRAGRAFERVDGQEAPPVAIVNEALARKYFPGVDPIGQRINTGTPAAEAPWLTIVGVAGNQKSLNVFQEMTWVETPFLFRPMAQNPAAEATLLLRSSAPPASMGASIQRVVANLDPDIPVTAIETMRQRIAKDFAYPQFRAAVLGGFSVLALLLAVVGLYAVLSQLVAQRAQEFGVRVALGARSWDIVRLVGIQGGVPTLAGLAIGVACVIAFERVLASLLYGVTASDPKTLAGVALVLFAMASLAMFVPARKATQVDPLSALRSE
jgi:putative ABC transport system permease protein